MYMYRCIKIRRKPEPLISYVEKLKYGLDKKEYGGVRHFMLVTQI